MCKSRGLFLRAIGCVLGAGKKWQEGMVRAECQVDVDTSGLMGEQQLGPSHLEAPAQVRGMEGPRPPCGVGEHPLQWITHSTA